MQFVDRELAVDQNVVEAMALYFLLGLSPGSFGRALIINNRNMAYRHAHHMLYRVGDDLVPNHFTLVQEYLPDECWGSVAKYEDWKLHQGLKYADPAVKVKLRLQLGRNFWPFTAARYTSAMDYLWECEREIS
jgi:hypothetical protein